MRLSAARRWLLALTATLALVGCATATASAPEAPMPDARAWLLVDSGDGTVLAGHAGSERAPIASTTKLMTAYLALRDLRLGERVVAPPYHPIPGESLMGLKAGERWSVRDLLYGLLLPSGNDAAVALADAAAGSEDAFVAEMNRAARRLGLDGTHYANPVGLDEPGNYSTAADLVSLTERLRRDPTFRRIVDTPAKTVSNGTRAIHLENRNTLLAAAPWVNGDKTGHTLEAGYVLVGSGARRHVDLVSALLGAPSEAARDAGSLALLRYGFSLYRSVIPVEDGERLATTALAYREERLPLTAARPVRLTVRRGQDVETRVVRVPAEVDQASRGERLGAAVVTVDGAREGRVPLVAARSVGEADLGDRLDSALPGSRAIAWLIVAAGVILLAAILIGIIATLARGRPGR